MLHSGHVKFHDDLAPLMRDIDSVRQHPQNYNNGDMDRLEQSVEVNGMYRPIYVQKSTGYIIAGNHTWMTCKQMEAKEIPVVMLDVDDAGARRIMVADNYIASLAQPDNGLLLALMDQIAEESGDVVGSGMSAEEVETLRMLNDIPFEDGQDFAQWPTFSARLPPHTYQALMFLTRDAEDDRQRIELLLRMAGWDGSQVG